LERIGEEAREGGGPSRHTGLPPNEAFLFLFSSAQIHSSFQSPKKDETEAAISDVRMKKENWS
jgi:hypothetical protein